MKIKEGFKLRTLCNETVVMAESNKLINFNKLIRLNESAAYLWKCVEGKDFSIDDLANFLVDNYEVDLETAKKDSANLAKSWIEAGIVEEAD